ncbi:cupin domain-containing protein [Amycolatopsis sp. NPDC005232]|uniref:JmjC domain-containing protein n=1 Tax=Amycolatopsis sp. NPDC005232 TaxID=3157027 RepID=UPI0033BE8ADE
MFPGRQIGRLGADLPPHPGRKIMDHHLVTAIEKALGWSGPHPLGQDFAYGSMAEPALCSRLLTPGRLLDTIMRRPLSSPQFRCFQNGEEIHPDRYLADVATRRGPSRTMARMDRLGQLMKSGCTIVLDTLDTFDPTMEVTCQAMQWWSRELVQVNVYLTTHDAAGFNMHWDDHDVIVVQLGGEKSWEVRETSRIAPMYRDTERATEPPADVLWSGTMKTGDVMHIPRGYWHKATRAQRGDGYSLHATFGFVKRTGVDWLSWVADRSREREIFRLDLDRWGTPESQEAEVRRLFWAVPAVTARHPQAEYLAARERERPSRRHVTTLGVFGSVTDVVCMTDFPPHFEYGTDTLDVLGAGKRLTFATAAEPALHLLLSGVPVNLDEVSRSTGIDAHAVAGPLLDAGLCAELTEELASGFAALSGGA